MTLEESMRETIRAIVRDEVDRALAAHAVPAEYLSTGEAAELARVAPGTIRRWIREHRLEQHRAGREVRVRRAELENLLRSGRRPANDATDLTPEQQALRDFG